VTHAEQELRATLRAVMTLATDALTDEELAGLNLCVQLGHDPRTRPWYAKIAYVFDQAGGTAMHEESRAALLAITLKRLRPVE